MQASNTLIKFPMKQMALAAASMLVVVSGMAHADISTSNNNFTMLTATGVGQGGTNDVAFTWDGTYNTAVAGSAVNATIASPTPFFSNLWTAHHVRIFGPGTYQIYTGCAADDLGCGVGGLYTLTVGAGQLGAHMLFDWNNNLNIDVIQLFTHTPIGSVNQSTDPTLNNWRNSAGTVTGTQINPYWNGVTNALGLTRETVWDFVSIDTDQDAENWNGTKFIDGPFASPASSANFNLNGLVARETALAVRTLSPASGATGAATASPITVQFNKGVNVGTVTGATFSVKRTSDNAPVAGTVSCTAPTDCLFTPNAAIQNVTQYTVTLTSGITDLALGTAFAGTAWSFTTGTAQTLTVSGATVSVPAPATMVSLSVMASGDLAGTPPARTAFGEVLNYTATSVVGGQVVVTLIFPSSIAGKDLYKYRDGQYTLITETTAGCTFVRDSVDTKKITMTVVDGGFCDTAGTAGVADGTVTDPIVAGVTAAVPQVLASGPAGGGCAYDPRGAKDGSLILALMAGLGFAGWRSRRQR